ncbi:Lar family restriction alleviation protein [uncultured Olegusella sp.]|uniref:Lar family restriction alleviation protein n=1 Tax=uncultured Olegusella sp. TaxID=1979846 RepID=UPI00345C9726
MTSLKPCPFCGGTTQRVKSSGRWGWFVSCSCAAVGPSAITKELAIERWNTRTEPMQQTLFGEKKDYHHEN